MSLPGWHPDPSGDYEVRYWDGSTWTDAVANAGQSFTDPLTEPVLPEAEQVLWQHGSHQLSTHRAWVFDASIKREIQEIPLWSVAEVEVTATSRQHQAGTGRVDEGRQNWEFITSPINAAWPKNQNHVVTLPAEKFRKDKPGWKKPAARSASVR